MTPAPTKNDNSLPKKKSLICIDQRPLILEGGCRVQDFLNKRKRNQSFLSLFMSQNQNRILLMLPSLGIDLMKRLFLPDLSRLPDSQYKTPPKKKP